MTRVIDAERGQLDYRCRQLAQGDFFGSLDFEAIAVGFGPFDFGPVQLQGNLLIEKFDATPDSQDRESLIVKFEGGASLAGVGFDGQLLITEYGPIAASLSLSAGSVGVPLGPVTSVRSRCLDPVQRGSPGVAREPTAAARSTYGRG